MLHQAMLIRITTHRRHTTCCELSSRYGNYKCFGSYSIKIKRIGTQFKKYSQHNKGGYNIFTAAKQGLHMQ
jgi:hypothetical protein